MITVLSLILATALQAPASAVERTWVSRQTYAMGTSLVVNVAASDRQSGIDAIEAVFVETRRLEGLLSSWTSDSEIGHLNTAPIRQPNVVTAELMGLLLEAAEWSERTGGAFDPGVGALTDAWDMRGAGRIPDGAEIRSALASTGIAHFAIDAESGTVSRLSEGAWLDTGGFGKGVALRYAREVLTARGIESASLNFGGQLLVFGAPEGGGRWNAAVARPAARQVVHSTLQLDAGSVSTSAQLERFVSAGGKRFGHIIDPRTGLPLEPWGSVTVVAADPVAADVLSTALLVMGPVAGMEWAANQDEVGVLFLEDHDGKVAARWNHTFRKFQLPTSAR